MARVRVQAAELHVRETVEGVLERLGGAGSGVHVAGVRVTPPGWILLTEVSTNRQLYVQAGQIGYVHEDD